MLPTIRDDPAAGGHMRSEALHAAWWQALATQFGRTLAAVQSSMEWRCQQGALAGLDEHVLRDIGLTRMAVRCAGAGPAARVDAVPATDGTRRLPFEGRRGATWTPWP